MLGKKSGKRSKSGKFKQPPKLEPPQGDPFLALLKELMTYKDCPSTTPFYMVEKVLARIDKSYSAIALHWIGGEGIIIKACDEMQRRLAVKIALPHSQIIGQRTMTIWDQFRRRVHIKDTNAFKERFKAGADLQRRIWKEVQRERVTFFSVPYVNKISSSPGLYMEMPWIDSVGILRWFKSEQKSLQYRLNRFLTLLDATYFIHERGIVHRDLKANNVLIGGDNGGNEDSICILDWTLAREVGDDRNITVPGTQMGSLPHATRKLMADCHPEMATFVDDTYALGYTLWEFVVGALPKLIQKEDFENEKMVETYRRTLAKYLPDALRTVFLKATEQHEENRFQRVPEFRQTLRQAIDNIKFHKEEKCLLLENAEISDSTAISLSDEKILRDETEITEKCVEEFTKHYLEQLCIGCDGGPCNRLKTCQHLAEAVIDIVMAMKNERLI